MKESILHYIWQNKLFNQHGLYTSEGDKIEVIDVGKLNTDAGPDFFNAKVRIGETIWAGNIEIHLSSSDWYKHKHQNDSAYNNIILHVVKQIDTEITTKNGEKVPQLQLIYSELIEQNYEELLLNKKWVACADKIGNVPDIFIQSWKNTLLIERLEQKIDAIQQLLNVTNRHWEEAFYIILARSFGFSTNSQAFEQLALSTPLSILGKHKNSIFQIEALLFGQAGFLDSIADAYGESLKKEYQFLKAKYNLQSISVSQWKFLRLRPDNFPSIRIAQFAGLIHSSSKLFSKIIDSPEHEYLKAMFNCAPSDYWNNHYTFGRESATKLKHLGENSIDSLLINTVVPFLFCYAHDKSNQQLKDKALLLLERLPVEKNTVVTSWQKLDVKIESAYDSQAFLHLKKHYCDVKKCLQCRIGHKVLTISV